MSILIQLAFPSCLLCLSCSQALWALLGFRWPAGRAGLAARRRRHPSSVPLAACAAPPFQPELVGYRQQTTSSINEPHIRPSSQSKERLSLQPTLLLSTHTFRADDTPLSLSLSLPAATPWSRRRLRWGRTACSARCWRRSATTRASACRPSSSCARGRPRRPLGSSRR